MMSLIDLDDDQRWVPTHVNVTVLSARGLRTKGKHGSRYVYTIIQVGKEKYTTGLVEKAAMPQWNEECCFELLPGILEAGGRNAYPPGSGDLVLTVMHRVLIGLDVFLGQAIIPLDKIFNDGVFPRDEWLRLNSKAGRKEKERGELQVTVQFTRNNMTASMFDLTMKDKPRSAFGKLKDRVTGRKRGDMESSSAIVPGRFAALSGSPYGEEVGGTGVNAGDLEVPEDKKSKVKNFFKGRLRRSSDTRSCSSLASDSSASSMASEKPCPPPCLDLLADPPSSPIYSSKVREDTPYGETDLAQKVLTSQPSEKLTHKRAFSDEASKITTSFTRPCPAVESLKGQTMSQSQSSLCINGSHVYGSEPCTPKSSGTLPSKLVLLEKCSPLSRSLQNLTRRSDDKGSPGESRRWSFDKEKKEEEKEIESATPQVQSARIGARPVQAAALIVCSSTTADSADKGKKLRKTLFSGGRSDSLPAKSDMSQTGTSSEGRLRGWFGSSESQNKPRLEVSPKVESSSDLPPPIPPRSPIPPQCSSPTAILSSHGSPDSETNANPFSPSPSPTAISPTNPFLPRIQRNPFFEELLAEETRRSPPLASPSPSVSPLSHSTALSSQPRIPSPAYDGMQNKMAAIRRERPRAVARQTSLPAVLPRPVTPSSPNTLAPRSMSESGGELEESFDAFASSRLNSPKETPVSQHHSVANTAHAHRRSNPSVDNYAPSPMERLGVCEEEPPPLPPRRAVRTPVAELYTDSWLHRGQELAVQKEACLLSQTGAASLQRARDGERKTNAPSISPDLQIITTSQISDCITAPSHQKANMTSPVFMAEDKLRKFKYEPLEDQNDCFRGMLYEQDFCGPGVAGRFGEPKVNNALLSLSREETSGNEIRSKTTPPFHNHAAVTGSKMLLDIDISVADLVSMSVFQKNMSISERTDPASTTSEPTPLQPTDTFLHTKPPSVNNNMSPSFTLEDLNMNVNNSDFSFIDSDASSPSEITDTLKIIKGLDASFPQPSEGSPITMYHEDIMPASDNILPLNQTSLHELNSTFETDTLTDTPLKAESVCQNSCQGAGCELYQLSEKDSKNVNKDGKESTEVGPRETVTREMVQSKETQAALDDNGNPQAKVGTPFKNERSLKTVSARRSLKGMIRELHGSPTDHSHEEQSNLGHPSSPYQKSLEGPFSYQPTKLLSSPGESSLDKDQCEVNELNSKSLTFLHKATGISTETKQNAHDVTEKSIQEEGISFEYLHAKVAPDSRSPLKSKNAHSLHDSSSCASSPSSASSLSAGGNDRAKLPPTPTPSLYIQTPTTKLSLEVSATLAVTPYTSSSSFSSSSCSSSSSTTAQPPVDARHSLLPEETQPASNLPVQESSPHPVKPLTTTLSQTDKKEGRSVLEKLKSTIHPGRTTQQTVTEPEKSPELSVADAAQFQHLTNMELISLLLQQGIDMEKQQAASEQQGAMLEKREAELKKVKSQVRDLEDYIDKLLVRIMEQTPTLLQVRSRHK